MITITEKINSKFAKNDKFDRVIGGQDSFFPRNCNYQLIFFSKLNTSQIRIKVHLMTHIKKTIVFFNKQSIFVLISKNNKNNHFVADKLIVIKF